MARIDNVYQIPPEPPSRSAPPRPPTDVKVQKTVPSIFERVATFFQRTFSAIGQAIIASFKGKKEVQVLSCGKRPSAAAGFRYNRSVSSILKEKGLNCQPTSKLENRS